MGNEINIIHRKPFIFPLLKLFFPALDWEKHIITIGNTIYSKDKFSESTFEHEKVHVDQFRRSKLHFFKFLFSSKYRLQSELEAFREQIRLFPADREKVLSILSSGLYKININEAKKLL